MLEADLLELRRGQRQQFTGALCEAAKLVVMMHHRLIVGGGLKIDLDREIAGDRCVDRRRHVLDDAARAVMRPR